MTDLPNTREIQGRKSSGNIQEEALRKLRSESSRRYEHRSVTVPNNSTDLTLTSLDADFFSRSLDGKAQFVEIYSNAAITVKLRTEGNTDITNANLGAVNIRANTLRTINFVSDITELLFANASGGNAAVEVTAV